MLKKMLILTVGTGPMTYLRKRDNLSPYTFDLSPILGGRDLGRTKILTSFLISAIKKSSEIPLRGG